MSDNDPFAEPDDTDKTVIKPNPGGRRTPQVPAADPAAPTPAPAQPPEAAPVAAYGVPQGAQAPSPATPNAKMAMTGMNPLTACASTLFSLISRIRNRAQHMDPDKLRQSVVS